MSVQMSTLIAGPASQNQLTALLVEGCMRIPRLGLLTVALFFLHGCASNVPIEIRQSPAGAPAVGAVTADSTPYQGQHVRWGGSIVSVENKADETRLEILAKKLDYYGQPKYTDKSEGRFVARSASFLDPQIYRKDREITIYGTVEGSEAGKIGDKPYTFPVVKVEKFYLWPRSYADRDDPWCRDRYWRSALWYGHGYPGYFWYRHRLGYPYYWWWDPFWDPFPPHFYCRP